MQYVTEETERVAYLGFACIVFTVAMQASPLAVVVCKLYFLSYVYVYHIRVHSNKNVVCVAVRLKCCLKELKFTEHSCLVKESSCKILSAVREQALSKIN